MTAYDDSMKTFDMRDEIKKLSILVEYKANCGGVFYTWYVLEKLAQILASTPISLDDANAARFNRWKAGPDRLQ